MRSIKLEEVGGALIVECYRCHVTMPYMSALTNSSGLIFCGGCASDIREQAEERTQKWKERLSHD